VFTSTEDRSNGTIWKTDADGRNAMQIAPYGITPVVTHDDRAVIFMKRDGLAAWMVPIDGGTPTQITDGMAQYPDVSPDGKSLAFFRIEGSNRGAIIVCDLPRCKTLTRLPPPPTSTKLRWTPDGRGIAYHKDSNVWIQPLDGSPARQLTHFTDGRAIPDFAWSRDGKRLAIARMSVTNDIVLFRGLKKQKEE
jgi:Tol biopolymer transport system component